MKLLLDIKDSEAATFMQILKRIFFVKKVTSISDTKINCMQEIREAVDELKLVGEGKLKAPNVENLIGEL